ncbi:MAG: riboflavin synthase [Gammaproteobacteria bacterium]|nr:riboflavin synthase [Gammaproteobacteria bacterium]
MFTGIVQATGIVVSADPPSPDTSDLRLAIEPGRGATLDLAEGDSISVNGVCLTAVSVSGDGFAADVSAETISCTTLGKLAKGTRVNLETALTPATALGGHLVSGHVDGIGEIVRRAGDARSVRLGIRAPGSLARYIAPKGSVCVDGVSLTVNDVADSTFEVNIVPHTLDVTIMGDYRTGSEVNLEVDMIARYLERLLQYDRGPG